MAGLNVILSVHFSSADSVTSAAVAGWCMQMEDVRHIDEQM